MCIPDHSTRVFRYTAGKRVSKVTLSLENRRVGGGIGSINAAVFSVGLQRYSLEIARVP